jgi:hypothetical protein
MSDRDARVASEEGDVATGCRRVGGLVDVTRSTSRRASSPTLQNQQSALSCCHPARRLNIYGVHRIEAATSHEARHSMHASIACLLLYEDQVWVSLGNAMKAKQTN